MTGQGGHALLSGLVVRHPDLPSLVAAARRLQAQKRATAIVFDSGVVIWLRDAVKVDDDAGVVFSMGEIT
jgi:hypothetical protein